MAASSVHYTTSYEHSIVLLKMVEIIAPKHVELIGIINKSLLLNYFVVYIIVSAMYGHTNIKFICTIRRCIQKSQDNAHNTQVACSSRVFPLGCVAVVSCEWVCRVAWLDVEAFDCCTCLYVFIASPVCDFLISAVWRKLTNKECASSSVWDWVKREVKFWSFETGFWWFVHEP